MTKKKCLLISVMTAMLSFTNVSVYADPTDIELEVRYDDPKEGETGLPRTPILIPDVSLEDYTIFFNTPCDGCILRLLDEDGTVVYSTIIPTGATSLVLPGYLSGEYEIQIIQGNLCFYGYIFLE